MEKKGVLDRVVGFMAFLAGVLLVVAVFIICFEILMRYFVKSPQVWTVEVCEYILFSIAFLGAPWLLKVGGHVNIDIFVIQLSPWPKRMVARISALVGMIISGIICWFSLLTSYDCYVSGVVLTKSLDVPKHYFLLLIFLGYFFLLLEFGRKFLSNIRTSKEEG